MDVANLLNLLSDQRQTGLLEVGIDARIQDALYEVHTALPGVIFDYDASTNLASVQLGIKRYFLDGSGWVNIPLLVQVPVHIYRGGNWSITVPITPGDECLVVFAERDIDGWQQQGGQQAPIDSRMHSLSDGFALVGFNSAKRPLSNVAIDALEIRSNDRSVLISLKTDEIILQLSSNSSVTSIAINNMGVTINGNLQVNGVITHTP